MGLRREDVSVSRFGRLLHIGLWLAFVVYYDLAILQGVASIASVYENLKKATEVCLFLFRSTEGMEGPPTS